MSRTYCHTHSKYDCSTCADEILSLGIQVDKDRIAALERELERLRKKLASAEREREQSNARLHEVAVACATAERERDDAHEIIDQYKGMASRYKDCMAEQSVAVEVFDSHCNYASFAGRVCNKCGRIHDGGKSVPVVGEPDCYDAGLLGDFGGGNVEWWQDYIRAELARAHEFYAGQWPSASVLVVSNVVGYLAGGTLMRRKIQGYACKPLVVQPAHSILAAELATLREKAAEADELRKDAERYRWIRDPKSPADKVILFDRGTKGKGVFAFIALDECIDAAIAQEPKK